MSSFANGSIEFSRDMLGTQSSCLVAMSVCATGLHNLSTKKIGYSQAVASAGVSAYIHHQACLHRLELCSLIDSLSSSSLSSSLGIVLII